VCARGIQTSSTRHSEQENAHARHILLPVNKDILRYEDTQNRGVTGSLLATANASIEIMQLSIVCV
jgi:hypothetical protein